MSKEMCECGHEKGWHVPFDKPALNISCVCGGKTCECVNYRPTLRAVDPPLALPSADDNQNSAGN